MMEAMARVLVVDDEPHIGELVGVALRYNGFEVTSVLSGRAALDEVRRARPDLVVLDVMLPDLDGFEVAKRIRETDGGADRVPVIFLTARDATADKIAGLGLGGDDYVTKPFSVEELVARVHAVLRRSAGSGPSDQRVVFADLTLDENTREVWRGSDLVELTATEYRLAATTGQAPSPARVQTGGRARGRVRVRVRAPGRTRRRARLPERRAAVPASPAPATTPRARGPLGPIGAARTTSPKAATWSSAAPGDRSCPTRRSRWVLHLKCPVPEDPRAAGGAHRGVGERRANVQRRVRPVPGPGPSTRGPRRWSHRPPVPG